MKQKREEAWKTVEQGSKDEFTGTESVPKYDMS